MGNIDLLSRAVSLNELDQSSGVFIVNHGFAAYLKLGGKTDGYDDRYAYAHEGDRGSQDPRYIWQINSVDGDQYSFQNFSQTGGFLFRGGQTDGDGDYTIWGHNRDSIDGSKGDRYKFTFSPIDGSGNVYNIYADNKYILKAGNSLDGDGDHQVYAQSNYNNADRYQWILVPVP